MLDASDGGGEAAFMDKVRLGQKFGGSLASASAAPASGGARSLNVLSSCCFGIALFWMHILCARVSASA